jgi:hypothetical protein
VPEPTREYKTVPRGTWRKMQRLAHTLDVEKGGLYDARSGCINLWVSLEDHPKSWDGVEMSAGAFPEPREYLGAVNAEITEDLSEAVLTLVVTPYTRLEQRQAGRYPPPEEDEWEWLMRKAQALLDKAESLLEPPGAESGIFCKLCEAPVRVRSLNDFLDHLIGEHNLQVTAVELGAPTRIITNIGPVEV